MDPFYERAAMARSVRTASDSLLEASERACELKRFQVGHQLLDQSVQLHHLARELLELPRQATVSEEQLDLPW
jgi:hypothetical protein